jgi:hypothetical protein
VSRCGYSMGIVREPRKENVHSWKPVPEDQRRESAFGRRYQRLSEGKADWKTSVHA